MHDYDNPFKPRNPFKTSWSESVKNFLIISAVIVVVGGGIFALAYMALDSGYGACLVVRCVKIIN